MEVKVFDNITEIVRCTKWTEAGASKEDSSTSK